MYYVDRDIDLFGMTSFQYDFIQLRKCNTERSVKEWSGICVIIMYAVPVSAWDMCQRKKKRKKEKKEKVKGKIKRVMAKIEKEEQQDQIQASVPQRLA